MLVVVYERQKKNLIFQKGKKRDPRALTLTLSIKDSTMTSCRWGLMFAYQQPHHGIKKIQNGRGKLHYNLLLQ